MREKGIKIHVFWQIIMNYEWRIVNYFVPLQPIYAAEAPISVPLTEHRLTVQTRLIN